jgi:hypothetical protein
MARLDPVDSDGIGDGAQEAGKNDVRRASKSLASDNLLTDHTKDRPHTKPDRAHAHASGSTAKLIFCAVGTFLSFMVFGIFQERM